MPALLCCAVLSYVETVRWADHPSKESYQTSKAFVISESLINRNSAEGLMRDS
jgi:hypothetical protein